MSLGKLGMPIGAMPRFLLAQQYEWMAVCRRGVADDLDSVEVTAQVVR